MLRQFDPFDDLGWPFAQLRRSGVASPALPMDAVRSEQGVTVRFDLPGVDPSAVDLTVEKNELTVEAERRDDLAEGEQYLTHERPTGQFRRTIYLGDTLDADAVEASWDNGVLVVRIPVAEAAKARRVEIAGGPTEARAVETGGS